MSLKVKLALISTILLWASAFVGIRAALHGYSPEGLALLRYIIASICLGMIYFRFKSQVISIQDKSILMVIGVFGIGIYNIALNYGELFISGGMASFIISQAPIITTIFAIIFLGEQFNLPRTMGFLISLIGVFLIGVGENAGFKWDSSLFYILISTIISGVYSVVQKPFLKKYSAIQVATYIIWGGTLFLMLYINQLAHDLSHASLQATLMVGYLGIFPAALGYVGWSYVLTAIPASRAVSFLYFMPFIATLLGWLLLGETPMFWSIIGGLLAIFGVWLVNQSYIKLKPIEVSS